MEAGEWRMTSRKGSDVRPGRRVTRSFQIVHSLVGGGSSSFVTEPSGTLVTDAFLQLSSQPQVPGHLRRTAMVLPLQESQWASRGDWEHG